MSDYEYDPDYDNEPQDNDEIDWQTDRENFYYTGEDEMNANPEVALEEFKKVLALEKENDSYEFSFQSLKHILIIYCKLNKTDLLEAAQKQFLDQMSGKQNISANNKTEAIHDILDELIELKEQNIRNKLLENLLAFLKDLESQENLWINASLRLCKIYLDNREYDNLQRILSSVKKTCVNPDGSDNHKKAQTLLELYSLEIQVCILQAKTEKLRDIYKRTRNLIGPNSIQDPKIMGIIKETNGQMLMYDKNFDEAATVLMEAFKDYQEVGNFKAKVVLKYVVLASILSMSTINPFDQAEAKVYKEEKEIKAIQELRAAYDAKDVASFNNIINSKEANIKEDNFMNYFIDELKKVICLEKIRQIVDPYTTVRVNYIGRVLACSNEQVEKYLQEMILDGKLDGSIDDVEGYFENSKYQKPAIEREKEKAINDWLSTIQSF